tara:strand:- start:971 stop:1111 length:141 start_codon:yes stop_codon:yes gene_type:complete
MVRFIDESGLPSAQANVLEQGANYDVITDFDFNYTLEIEQVQLLDY